MSSRQKLNTLLNGSNLNNIASAEFGHGHNIQVFKSIMSDNSKTYKLNDRNLGSSAQQSITKNKGKIGKWLYLKLGIAAGTLVTREMWALNAIKEVIVRYPGLKDFKISKQALFCKLMSECNTSDKRNKLIAQMGLSVTNPSVTIYGYVPIPLFDTMIHTEASGPDFIDLYKMGDINIEFVYDSSSEVVSSGTLTSFNNAELLYKSFSTEDALKQMEDKKDTEFVYEYVQTVKSYTGSASEYVDVVVDTLKQNVELVDLMIMRCYNSDISSVLRYEGKELDDIIVTDGTTEIYKSHNNHKDLVNLIENDNDDISYTYNSTNSRIYKIPLGVFPETHSKRVRGTKYYVENLTLRLLGSDTTASKLYITFVYRNKVRPDGQSLTLTN